MHNGTQMMTAFAVLVLHDEEKLVRVAEIAVSLSLEALSGISDAFDNRIHQARPHFGQIKSARNIKSLISGSKIILSSEELMNSEINRTPQDPYSLRCAPQVLGTVRDTLLHIRKIIEIEINSATDNPLIFYKDGIE